MCGYHPVAAGFSGRILKRMMEETELQHEDEFWWRQRGSYVTFMTWFLILVFAGTWMFVGLRIWERQQRTAAIQKVQTDLDRLHAQGYYEATDTYGGKTPQETLQLYIDAVEKGDYVLASRYFIGDFEEQELQNLTNATAKELSVYVAGLKKLGATQGSYSKDGATFALGAPGVVTLTLTKSASGVWKIEEL